MNEYATSLKEKLTALIREMSAVPAPWMHCSAAKAEQRGAGISHYG